MTTSKRNGRSWLLGISASLFTALAMGSFGLLVSLTGDVSTIAASMEALIQREDRQDARWTKAYDELDDQYGQLDGRLRDMEFGER